MLCGAWMMKEIKLPLTYYQLGILALIVYVIGLICSIFVFIDARFSLDERTLALDGIIIFGIICCTKLVLTIDDLYHKGKLFRFTCKCDKR